MNLQPVGNRIIVKQLLAPKQSPGGVTLPQKSRDAQQRGEVVAMSHTVDLDFELALGEVIVFDKYIGIKVEDDAIEYIILTNKEILAKVVE